MTVAAPVRRYLNAKKFRGSYIPEWIETRPEISSPAKLVYARLLRYAADKDGRGWIAWPSQQKLCSALGLFDKKGAPNTRLLRDYLKELVDFKLLEPVRVGLGRSNFYRFLVHEIMPGEGEDPTTEEPNDPGPEDEAGQSDEGPDSDFPDRGNFPGPERGNSPGLDRGEIPGPDRGKTTAQERGNSPGPLLQKKSVEHLQLTSSSSPATELQSGRGGRWEKSEFSEKARNVMAFIRYYTEAEVSHPGNILARLEEGYTAYDCVLAFWKFCEFGEKHNQNAIVPFQAKCFGAILDQARTNMKRGLNEWWATAQKRGLVGAQAEEFVRSFGRLTPDGLQTDLLHFAQHGCLPPDEQQQAVAS